MPWHGRETDPEWRREDVTSTSASNTESYPFDPSKPSRILYISTLHFIAFLIETGYNIMTQQSRRSATPISASTLCLLAAVFSGLVACDAFVSPRFARSNQLVLADRTFAITSAVYVAKKKRRRRKESTDGDDDSFDLESGELPDFDMEEDNPEPTKKSKISLNPDEITAAMMGSATMPVRSVNELISDRALEKVFEFEEPEENLPDLAQLAKASNMDLSAPVSKKSKRNAARKAAATADEVKEGGWGGSMFANLPNGVTDENGKVNGPKLLDTGAWAGIGLLVLWEVYLNSPLFSRAGPIIPVVYDLVLRSF